MRNPIDHFKKICCFKTSLLGNLKFTTWVWNGPFHMSSSQVMELVSFTFWMDRHISWVISCSSNLPFRNSDKWRAESSVWTFLWCYRYFRYFRSNQLQIFTFILSFWRVIGGFHMIKKCKDMLTFWLIQEHQQFSMTTFSLTTILKLKLYSLWETGTSSTVGVE